MTISKSVAQKLQKILLGEKVSYASFGSFQTEIDVMLKEKTLEEKKQVR